jgi:hypothetical protein
MKSIYKRILQIIVVITFLVSNYFISHVMYSKYLRNVNGIPFPSKSETVTYSNYKSIKYDRIYIPSCGVDMAIDYENLLFINDSLMVVKKYSIPHDVWFIFRRIINIYQEPKIEEYYILRNDTLFSKESIDLGGHEIIRYFSFKFEDDSLKVGHYSEKILK